MWICKPKNLANKVLSNIEGFYCLMRASWCLIASLGCMQIVKQKQRFQRAVVSREEALAMFQENKFKVEIITGLPEDATISLYRCANHL